MPLTEFDPTEFVFDSRQLQNVEQKFAVRPVRWISWKNSLQSLSDLLIASQQEQKRVASLCGAMVLSYKFGYVFPSTATYALPNSNSKRMSFTHPELPEGSILAARVAILREVSQPTRLDVFRINCGLNLYRFEKASQDDDVILRDIHPRQFSRARESGMLRRRLILNDIEPMVRQDPAGHNVLRTRTHN